MCRQILIQLANTNLMKIHFAILRVLNAGTRAHTETDRQRDMVKLTGKFLQLSELNMHKWTAGIQNTNNESTLKSQCMNPIKTCKCPNLYGLEGGGEDQT